jgi:hypothetical protein
MRSSLLLALVATAGLSTLTACSGPNPDASLGTTNESQVGIPVTVLAASVPAGIECVVMTVTGADSETISTGIAAGATSATISLGVLAPGAITVAANAFNSACPGTGTPLWTSEAVQANIVAGVAAQIPIVLHANAQASGAVTFSLPAIAVAAGMQTSYAALADGTVRAWGANDTGQFGAATPTSSSVPIVVPGVTNAIQVAAGNGFACALRADHSVWCWGKDLGEFGGPAYGTVTPPVAFQNMSATQISAQGTNMALIQGSSLQTTHNTPGLFQTIGYATGGPVVSVASGGDSGEDACWVNEDGAAGCTGSPIATASGPSVLAPTGATQVFMGSENSAGRADFECAILVDGTVRCLGANAYGELATSNTTAVTVPTQPVRLPSVTSMALSSGTIGVAHACALGTTGLVYCTGGNTFGQLGSDTIPSTVYYTQVSNLTNVTAITAGQAHTCALDNAGAVHCWGQNDAGELGDGTTTTRFAPVTVLPW